MNKSYFEKFVLRNLKDIESIRCYIVDGYDLDGNESSWLDVYIYGVGIKRVYSSDFYPYNSKEVIKLQKRWVKKLESWINPYWGIPLLVDRVTV